MYSLSVIFNNNVIDRRAHGLATAAVFTYKNEMGEIEKKKYEKKTSNYVGNIKESITVDVNIAKIIELDGKWGITYMHIMFDDDGNQFVWFGSTQLNKLIPAEWENHHVFKKGKYYRYDWPDQGDKVNITATVKQHKEYNGTKQTVLTRCKLNDIIERAE